jgi:hypothetical protein
MEEEEKSQIMQDKFFLFCCAGDVVLSSFDEVNFGDERIMKKKLEIFLGSIFDGAEWLKLMIND